MRIAVPIVINTPYSMVKQILRTDILRVACIFPSPVGARKNTNNEQYVLLYYVLNHRIRDYSTISPFSSILAFSFRNPSCIESIA